MSEQAATSAPIDGAPESYRTLFEGASDAILLIHDGRFVHWNPVSLQIFGRTEEEMAGSRPADLSPETQPCGTSSELKAEELTDAALAGEPQRFEWTHKRFDGTLFPAEVALTRVETPDGPRVLAIVRDISQRKEVEDALRASEERYRTFFENSCDSMIMMKDARFIDCNAAAVQLFGFDSKDQILFTHPADTSPEFQPDGTSSYDRAREMIDRVLAQGTHRFEWDHVRPDGEVFPVEVAMTAIPSPDGTLLLCVLRDISSRKRAEAEREALEAQLRQSQKMEAIGQLAGGVAHDFNNLLQAISGYCEVARTEVEPGSKIHFDLMEVEGAAGRAADLTKQLLAFGRRQMLNLEIIDLDPVVEDLGKMVRRVIGENIRFETSTDPGPKTVYADRGQLEQVLMNLCINARDAMKEGGTLSVSQRVEVLGARACRDLGIAKPGKHVVLTVADTGHGMDQELHGRIFEPFFTTKASTEGTGLGLSMVYGIVQQHGGVIRVDSVPGEGTRFHTYLPFTEGSPNEAPTPVESAAPSGAELVLVAEDNDAVRRLARRHLESAGYTVLLARDGEEAIQIFDRNRGNVDLAFLDVVMPGIGGRGVSDHIRSVAPEVPVLFASGYSSGEVHENFILEADLELLQKPYRRDELLNAIRRLLDA